GYTRAESIAPESLFTLPCDILIPAARPDCIHEGNVDEVQARLVLQGANIPATEGAERRLHDRGILNVPDFIANAGGVICASVEFHGGNEDSALEEIRGKIRRNTRQVLEASRDQGVLPREAAVALARRRVEEAMSLRREFR
ncbi:MAG: Glu/Leu/Phe/Val dehydrogenase, partial [Gemmatimonadetes bacterium]|nr:Glu/Leu/Phe/Val dehydrogenase [Gemmatimonadota bacterium]